MYGLLLFNVRNTCCNHRLIILLFSKTYATEDIWLLDFNYLLSEHLVQVNYPAVLNRLTKCLQFHLLSS